VFFTGASSSSAVSQSVEIPAAPATLRFVLRIAISPSTTGSITASIDGATVFTAADTAVGYATYQPVSVDVSGFAGGSHVLRFSGATAYSGSASGASDSFEVDDVSLDAPAAVTPPTPPPAPATCRGLTATITGTEAADALSGTAGPEVIATLGGGGTVKAGGGDDVVCGGSGKDELRGQGGNDRLLGAGKRDKLKGGGGTDTCIGGSAKDKTPGCEKGPAS
jgi:Ca2+-binding RTX toxin-like protein